MGARMRTLVLGGTVFLGHAVAAEALHRGHEVVCAARGQSGPVPGGAELLAADRDQPGALDPLRGRRFDAVIDLAPMSYGWVAGALDALGDAAGHWTFVSSISVYADHETPGQRPGAALLAPRRRPPGNGEPADATLYGAIKVASEQAVTERLGDRAFVVRPGLIAGPGDPSDRFGYWPARMARGGRVVVPDAPAQPAQYVDVRDLAAWIVSAGEQRLAGTFDAVGEPMPLLGLLDAIRRDVGGDSELVEVGEAVLEREEVTPWAGPRSLPLWLPPSHYGMVAHDPAPAAAAGLAARPLADTVRAVLDDERQCELERERGAGLAPDAERAVLAAALRAGSG